MLDRILLGESPTAVFRALIAQNPALSNIDLADMLSDEFPMLTGEAMQLTWHWKAPGKSQGLSDSDLDAGLMNQFAAAGYRLSASDGEA
ncbi:hypothetical protein [Marilutibacter alkalisoli]|uniref:Uncharacterized protein n=1 Tax=Marilutibacter alkalisoli TaxID=2591633 RepID=A0A514BRA8_9GAMM|nr:hypothetical protein [Lysobacter alkalisoli]QDH69920.1 hypothetical protein FKV23_07310 [Lysobacter alkalisoli]